MAHLPTKDLLAQESAREAAWLGGDACRRGIPFINPALEVKRTPSANHMSVSHAHTRETANHFVADELLVRMSEKGCAFPRCGLRGMH
jgi:hypothetical protein